MKKNILENQFTLIYKGENILVWDNQLDEEYILHKVPFAKGEFVSLIKEEIENFEKETYTYIDQKEEIMKYIESNFEVSIEYPFDPDSPIFRRISNKKWFSIIMKINKMKLNGKEDREVNVMNVKLKPELIDSLVDNITYFRAYHMNKKHWITICLDGSLSLEEIYSFVNQSYENTK